jgi:hypothetical protein
MRRSFAQIAREGPQKGTRERDPKRYENIANAANAGVRNERRERAC